MGNALDLVLQMRKERLVREQADNENIEEGLKGLAAGFEQKDESSISDLLRLQTLRQQQELLSSGRGQITSVGPGGPTVDVQTRVEEEEQRRKSAEVDRRIRNEERKGIALTGITLKEDDVASKSEELSLDFNQTIEQFGIQARVDKDGNRSYTIPPQSELERRVQNRTISGTEVQHIGDMIDTSTIVEDVVAGFKELGVTDASEIGVFSDFGPFSIPAKFDLAAQFSKDPKYVALKQKLERAFQKYRKITTGAQASDRELRMLRPLIARVTSTPSVFFEQASDLVTETNNLINNRLNLYEAVGRDVKPIRALLAKGSDGGGESQLTADNLFEGLL